MKNFTIYAYPKEPVLIQFMFHSICEIAFVTVMLGKNKINKPRSNPEVFLQGLWPKVNCFPRSWVF